jgi:hypothetical protein
MDALGQWIHSSAQLRALRIERLPGIRRRVAQVWPERHLTPTVKKGV